MLVDLMNPESVVAWWAVYPERHGPLLADFARRRPDLRPALVQARRLIMADPRLAAEYSRAEAVRRQTPVRSDEPPSHDELLTQAESLND